MKKTYIIPVIGSVEIPLEVLLASSGVGTNGKDVGYGGIDDGTHDPSAPGYYDNIDDDEDW